MVENSLWYPISEGIKRFIGTNRQQTNESCFDASFQYPFFVLCNLSGSRVLLIDFFFNTMGSNLPSHDDIFCIWTRAQLRWENPRFT